LIDGEAHDEGAAFGSMFTYVGFAGHASPEESMLKEKEGFSSHVVLSSCKFEVLKVDEAEDVGSVRDKVLVGEIGRIERIGSEDVAAPDDIGGAEDVLLVDEGAISIVEETGTPSQVPNSD